ncbi:hypothetical protein [Paludisphaera sp.]|uniref:hypothetical protein n=1 Tax=Paludisphaera sp. TaxID=2017432 RepID=UPI00301C0326
MLRRFVTGAASGLMAAGTAFALAHHALFGGDPARHAEGFTVDKMLLLVAMGSGAIGGACLVGLAGSARLNRFGSGGARGALWGVAATAVLGLLSSSFHQPKEVEEHKARWARFGLPIGALIGALVGVALTRKTHEVAGSAEVDETSAEDDPAERPRDPWPTAER